MSVTLDQVGVKGPPDSWNAAPQFIAISSRLVDRLKQLQTRTQASADDPEKRKEYGLFVALHNGFVTLPAQTLVTGSQTLSSSIATVSMGVRITPMPGYEVIGVAHSHPVSDEFSVGDVLDFRGRSESDWMSFLSTPKNIWMILRTKKTNTIHTIPSAPSLPHQDPSPLEDYVRARKKVYDQSFSQKNAEMYASFDMVRLYDIALYRLEHNDRNLLKKMT